MAFLSLLAASPAFHRQLHFLKDSGLAGSRDKRSMVSFQTMMLEQNQEVWNQSWFTAYVDVEIFFSQSWWLEAG